MQIASIHIALFFIQSDTMQMSTHSRLVRTFSLILNQIYLQIPFGILAKKYGSLSFLGWGMFINSIFGFLVPISAKVSY